MAALTEADYKWCIDWIRSQPTHKEELKLSGLSRTQLTDTLQALEDYHTGAYNSIPSTTIKATIETATGETPTLAQNKVMWYAWSAWKATQT